MVTLRRRRQVGVVQIGSCSPYGRASVAHLEVAKARPRRRYVAGLSLWTFSRVNERQKVKGEFVTGIHRIGFCL